MSSGDLVTHIYTLHAPDGEIRYVGKTILPIETRLKLHISNAKRCATNNHCAYWILSLLRNGETPLVKLVEVVVGDRWAEVERHWIAHHRERGCRLTNLTDGGEGMTGYRHTPEELVKMSVGSMGKKHSPETRAKLSEIARHRTPTTGWRHTETAKAEMRVKALRRDYSESRLRQIAARIVDPDVVVLEREYERPESWREAISLAKRGSRHHLAKLDEESVAQIKVLLLDRKLTQMEIGAMYGVSREAIGLIQRNKRWAHVPWPCEVTSWR